jgi:hypothetical protein
MLISNSSNDDMFAQLQAVADYGKAKGVTYD